VANCNQDLSDAALLLPRLAEFGIFRSDIAIVMQHPSGDVQRPRCVLSETLSQTEPASTGVAASVQLRMQSTVVARLISLQTIFGIARCCLARHRFLSRHPLRFRYSANSEQAPPGKQQDWRNDAFRWP
jgi:hypothetical protein